MIELVHGGDIYSAKQNIEGEILDFSANINPLGLPENVKSAIAAGLSECVNYPDPLCRDLTEAIADFEGVKKEWILCGNGAADLIIRLVRGLKPKKAVVLAPTFAEYEKALIGVDCEILPHLLYEADGFQVKENFLDVLDASVDMVFLCNPNNPTGQLIERGLLDRIADRCRELGIFLVMDECFNDFLEDPDGNTLKERLSTSPKLLLLKAFTKIYAMAGLRLGYGICSDEQTIEAMYDAGQPWSVSLPAQLGGIQALKETKYREETARVIRQERGWLTGELERLGIEILGGAANYLFLKAPYEYKEQLRQRGILIRCCSNYRGLEKGYFRIAVKSHRDNECLIRAVESVQKEV